MESATNIITLEEVRTERRSTTDRRIIDRRLHSPQEVDFAQTCALAGAKFVGIQKAIPECNVVAHVLFNDSYGSTLALPIDKFTLGAVAIKVGRSNARWRHFRGLR